MSFVLEELKVKINAGLDKLKENDRHLLTVNASERSITSKLASYLQVEFSEYNVDSEYNRLGKTTKILRVPKDNKNWDDLKRQSVFPDIIVHERGPEGKNILVIEVKKSTNPDPGDADKAKLQAFRKEPYNYEFGLFLKVGIGQDKDEFEWFFDE